jgi:hypothetical protein
MVFQKVTRSIFVLASILSFYQIAEAAPKTNPQKVIFQCPEPNQLVKSAENHWGTTDGNFRNFDTSFAKKLDRFIGAQWQGANLGYVTCVYQPNDASLFYVTVLFNKLTYQPDTQNTSWTKSKKGPWYNCMTKDPKDCTFKIRPKPKKANLYNEAESLKQEANPYDNPGF